MLDTARRGLFAQLVVVPLHNRHRILTQVAGDYMAVIKLLPPLMIGDVEVETFLSAFDDVMADAARPNGLAADFGKTLMKQAITRSCRHAAHAATPTPSATLRPFRGAQLRAKRHTRRDVRKRRPPATSA